MALDINGIRGLHGFILNGLYIVGGLVIVMSVLFFILGKKSQKGSARGLQNGKLAPCSAKPNCVSSEDGTPSKAKIAPLSINSLAPIKTAIEAAGGIITASEDNYLAAEFTSGFYKFVDDVEARLDGGQIHIRSASRVGYSDRGVNRKRVEALRAAVET